jgi:hypothetical protein
LAAAAAAAAESDDVKEPINAGILYIKPEEIAHKLSIQKMLKKNLTKFLSIARH